MFATSMYKIVITGPESSGKTSLAQQLAQALNAPWVPEFARPYVEWLGRPYERADLKAIARGQSLWENWHAAQAGPYLICDTDWTVLQIWETYRFGGSGNWEQGYLSVAPADLYLLCSPDFPWEQDPLREHPEERDALFELYLELMKVRGLNFQIMEGPLAGRISSSIGLIDGIRNKIFNV